MNRWNLTLTAINGTALLVELVNHLTSVIVALVLLLNAIYSAYELYHKWQKHKAERLQLETSDASDNEETATNGSE